MDFASAVTMERAKEIELLSQCLGLVQNQQAFMTDDEALVPVVEYIDETRFEKERDALFRRSMNVVGHSSQIAEPGDFITREVVGMPVILVRDEDGTAKAFVNT